jgi:hypothetical protein
LDARAKARQSGHVGGAFDFDAFFTALFEHFGDVFIFEPGRNGGVFFREILLLLLIREEEEYVSCESFIPMMRTRERKTRSSSRQSRRLIITYTREKREKTKASRHL